MVRVLVERVEIKRLSVVEKKIEKMSEWVAVVQEEGDEPIEIPAESDGTILLTSLTAQFPGVTGLKFRNPETNTLRGVRCSENKLYPPSEEEGWGKHTFICTRQLVRKL